MSVDKSSPLFFRVFCPLFIFQMIVSFSCFAADCDSENSQQETLLCLERAYAAADGDLNRVWKTVQQKISSRSETFRSALLQSQKFWIEFRDANCHSVGKEMEGGSAEASLVKGCLLRMTLERATELKNRFEVIP